MKKYLEFYADKKKNRQYILIDFLKSLSKKQRISLVLITIALISNQAFAILSQPVLEGSYKTVKEILTADKTIFIAGSPLIAVQSSLIATFAAAYFIVDIIKSVMVYITKIQTQSIEYIAKMDFGSEDMFNHMLPLLTTFAVIGCAYKLVMHFFKTERLDNVNAFLGYFGYTGMLVLFIFSGKIVDGIVSWNRPMSANAINQIFVKIDDELNKNITTDFKEAITTLEKLQIEYDSMSVMKGDMGGIISNRFEAVTTKVWDMGFKHMFKYMYYAFFSIIMVVVLAIPAFSITFMVKILLGVMIAGVKIVFLMSFIPGFESTWKTFLLNVANVTLWVPIFNAIIAFLTNIISFTISDNSMGTGQIIWLSLVVVIGAYNSLSLTTTAAGTIISGAGASMAGAMGSLSSMNAASMVSGAGQAALSAGMAIATGGGSSAGTVASLSKFLK